MKNSSRIQIAKSANFKQALKKLQYLPNAFILFGPAVHPKSTVENAIIDTASAKVA